MAEYKNKVERFNVASPAELFFQFGLTPSEIEEEILALFSQYFTDINNLKTYSIPFLFSSFLSYLTLIRDKPDASNDIIDIIALFNRAKIANESATIEAYLHWLPKISDSVSKYWSFYNSYSAVESAYLEDFAEESFRAIGQIIEGVSKYFLKLIFHLNKIANNKNIDLEKIESYDLGIIVDDLMNTVFLNKLLTVGNNSLRINQWRNIAYHHNYKIQGDDIICWFTNRGVEEKFALKRQDVSIIVKDVYNLYKLLKLSQIFFYVDNISSIDSAIKSNNIEISLARMEYKLLDLHSALASQGFKIIELHYDDDNAVLVIKDMIEYDLYLKRGIYSSQFLYNLWVFNNSFNLTIQYYTFSGELFLVSSACSSIFTQKASHSKEVNPLDNINYNYIGNNMTQDVDPFVNLDFIPSANCSSVKFYSQLGKRININEFIKQFSLSVFINYIAMLSEGFCDNDLTVSVGGNGSIVAAQNHTGNMVLHTPASIKDEKLQFKLCKMIDDLLTMYKQGVLSVDIVKKAMHDNKYYLKKRLIKDKLKSI